MQAESSAANIVAIGRFDPDAFRLIELGKSGALSAQDIAAAVVVAQLPKHLTHFTLPWGEVVVERERLQVSAKRAPLVCAADLVARMADHARDHFRIRAFGINYEAHYDLGSSKARDAFAIRLAPPDTWGEWGRAIKASMESEDPSTHGGLAVLTMRERFHADDILGWFDVTLTVSETIPNNRGVRLLTNHHHEQSPKVQPAADVAEEKRAAQMTATLLAALETSFDDSIAKAERVIGELLQ